MNKTKKILIGLSAACCAALALAGCASLDKTVTDLIGKGNNVVIEYDQTGGLVASQDNMYLKDLFSEEALAQGIRLLEPGDSNRGGDAANESKVSRSGYSLIGWYRERMDRVDEAGNPLDEDGKICNIGVPVTDEDGNPVLDENGEQIFELVSENGKPQSYMYSGLWNFATDVVTEEMTHEAKLDGKKVKMFTLYAAWAPDYTYVFYENVSSNGESWTTYGDPVALPANAESIDVPTWSNETGRIDHNNAELHIASEEKKSDDGTVEIIPERYYSMLGLYADAQLQTQYASYATTATDTNETIFLETIPHPGRVDKETGTAYDTIVKLYTTWREGRWYRVTSAANFSDNAVKSAGAGNFVFTSDVDFTPTKDEKGNVQAVIWSSSALEFSGVIYGNGHTVKAIDSAQTSQDVDVAGGVFGSITKNAQLIDISFEDVCFNIGKATNKANGYYGLLAGRIDTGATLTNVKISGEILIGDPYPYGSPAYKNYSIGLVCGNMLNAREETNEAIVGINTENIFASVDRVSTGIDPANKFKDIYGWLVKVSVDENGFVVITANEEPLVPTYEIRNRSGVWSAQGILATLNDTTKIDDDGTYDFIVKNDSSAALRFAISLAEYLDDVLEEEKAFLEYRLTVSGTALDEDAAWLPIGEIDYSGAVIQPGTELRFTLEWRWNYEPEDEETKVDEKTTLYDITKGEVSIGCFIRAEVVED